MEIKKLREILRDKKVSGIIYKSIYFQDGQIIKDKSTMRIKEMGFWDIWLKKYLFLNYINSENNLCKTILITDFINEILTNDISDVEYDFIQDHIGVKSN